MNAKSHRAIGVLAASVVINIELPFEFHRHTVSLITSDLLSLVIFFVLSWLCATAPDLDLLLVRGLKSGFESSKKGKKNADHKSRMQRYHRQLTHSILLFVLLFWAGVAWLDKFESSYWVALYFGFLTGVISHIVADIFSGSVPLLFWGSYYKSKLRVGLNGDWFRTEFVRINDAYLFFFYYVFAFAGVVWFFVNM